MSTERRVLTLSDAEAILVAARAKAAELGVSLALTVLDHAGQPVASMRMDESPLMAVAMANGKAYTAVGMGQPTQMWEGISNESPSFAGSITSVAGFTPFGGGVPLFVGTVLVGGFGVSGGSVAEDIAVAEAGAAAIS